MIFALFFIFFFFNFIFLQVIFARNFILVFFVGYFLLEIYEIFFSRVLLVWPFCDMPFLSSLFCQFYLRHF